MLFTRDDDSRVTDAGRLASARRVEVFRRLLMLIFFYAIPVIGALRPITDPDIWWHLRVGEWIVKQRAVPWADTFSTYGMGKPWVAYSWLFEVLVYGLHSAFGVMGLVFLVLVMSLGIAIALHGLIRRIEPPFAFEIVLAASGMLAMLALYQPRPWLFTIFLFLIELNILVSVWESGTRRPLIFLPLVFVVWANINIQFVYGLFVLALAFLKRPIEHLVSRGGISDSGAPMTKDNILALVACVAATLLSPYHLYMYLPVVDAIRLTDPFLYISELRAPAFRSASDWMVLGLALGASFSLGWRRSLRPFPVLLLVTGVFLSFRASRDVWFIVIAAVVILASSNRRGAREHFALTKRRMIAVGVVVAIISLAYGSWAVSPRRVEAAIAAQYPVAAAAFVEARGYQGPLFNHYDWGGYLIWRLPYLTVSVDGRNTFHGDARIWRSIRTWQGQRDWASDQELVAARLVIAKVDLALTSLLKLDPRFGLVYEDSVAAVFVARAKDAGGR